MLKYKLWIEIEEHDSETDIYRDVTAEGECSPVPLGSFDSMQEAVEHAEALEFFFNARP